jgi:predicted ester cyclase
MNTAFSDLKHDIHHIVAEGDSVAVGITFRAKHNGPYEDIAATGKPSPLRRSLCSVSRRQTREEWVGRRPCGCRETAEGSS